MNYRQSLLRLSACCLVAGFLTVSVSAQSASPDAAASQEPESPLNVLIGEWDLATRFALPDGKSMEGRAELSVRPILDGRGVQIDERHTPIAPGRPVFTSTSIFVADPKSGVIKGASVDSLGKRLTMEGEAEDGTLVLEQSGELFGGRIGKNRLTWFAITDDSFSLRLDIYTEAEGEWKENQYSYTATRSD